MIGSPISSPRSAAKGIGTPTLRCVSLLLTLRVGNPRATSPVGVSCQTFGMDRQADRKGAPHLRRLGTRAASRRRATSLTEYAPRWTHVRFRKPLVELPDHTARLDPTDTGMPDRMRGLVSHHLGQPASLSVGRRGAPQSGQVIAAESGKAQVMGFRFRKSVQLFPGVRLNFSRSGVSTTIGVRGAGVTIGPRGTYANVGLPGTGLSYRARLDRPVGGRRPSHAVDPFAPGWIEPRERNRVFRAMRRRAPTPPGLALMKGSVARRSNT